MNPERTQWLGQREELKMRAAALSASIESLRSSIRTTLNPFIPVHEIDAVLLPEQAFELAQKVQQYKEIRLKIEHMSRELGDRNI